MSIYTKYSLSIDNFNYSSVSSREVYEKKSGNSYPEEVKLNDLLRKPDSDREEMSEIQPELAFLIEKYLEDHGGAVSAISGEMGFSDSRLRGLAYSKNTKTISKIDLQEIQKFFRKRLPDEICKQCSALFRPVIIDLTSPTAASIDKSKINLQNHNGPLYEEVKLNGLFRKPDSDREEMSEIQPELAFLIEKYLEDHGGTVDAISREMGFSDSRLRGLAYSEKTKTISKIDLQEIQKFFRKWLPDEICKQCSALFRPVIIDLTSPTAASIDKSKINFQHHNVPLSKKIGTFSGDLQNQHKSSQSQQVAGNSDLTLTKVRTYSTGDFQNSRPSQQVARGNNAPSLPTGVRTYSTDDFQNSRPSQQVARGNNAPSLPTGIRTYSTGDFQNSRPSQQVARGNNAPSLPTGIRTYSTGDFQNSRSSQQVARGNNAPSLPTGVRTYSTDDFQNSRPSQQVVDNDGLPPLKKVKTCSMNDQYGSRQPQWTAFVDDYLNDDFWTLHKGNNDPLNSDDD